MIARQRLVKSILWALVGILVIVTVARFKSGLGSMTNLNDSSPWGLWIAFDVMAGVALAAGGFVLAATVHIFHLEKYERFVRPAILTALLGYAAVAVGLLYDLGLPWHIWHPMIYPQAHSVLFEVAMCVMLYLTVLFLEFSPVILEHPKLNFPILVKARKIILRFTIPLVIAGIVLSTLHQSSLGSLFLITPYRLHELWYSPIIWILFFISAIGLGLLTVILESYFSGWLYGHRLRMDLLSGLARAAAVVLGLYGILRLTEITIRGELGSVFDGSMEAWVFILEMLLSAAIPAFLLSRRKIRENPKALGWTALAGVMGVIGFRFNVCLVAFKRPEDVSYFPSWMELAVTVGIVAGGTLIFLWFIENLRVFPEEHGPEEHEEAEEGTAALDKPSFAPQSFSIFLPESLAAPRRYSMAALIGAALAVVFLPTDALFGPEPVATPVQESRSVEGIVRERQGTFGHEMFLSGPDVVASPLDTRKVLTVIDGNRDGRLVLFNHKGHEANLGEDDSCILCHHQNVPFQENSQCFSCHQDMYSPTDIFDHFRHVDHFDGNDGCESCHVDSSLAKTRETAKACLDCHEDMVREGSRVALPEEGMTGMAVGYMDAMHELCIKCHEEKVAEEPEKYPVEFAECLNCHRDEDGSSLRQLSPYLTRDSADGKSERSARVSAEHPAEVR
jgi:Ni/Fe-hydrogenase subunit HybB-like protein